MDLVKVRTTTISNNVHLTLLGWIATEGELKITKDIRQ